MPRSNHPRHGGSNEPEPLNVEQLKMGLRRTETKRDGEWNVQPQSASAASKEYTCPGCGLVITPGTGHLVAWRADGLFGEADDLAARRHWHNHCWKTRP